MAHVQRGKNCLKGYILCDTFPEQVSSCLKQFFGQHKTKVPGLESSVGLTTDPLSYRGKQDEIILRSIIYDRDSLVYRCKK